MAVFVVFVTTYMLILPAITLSVGSSGDSTSQTVSIPDYGTNAEATYTFTNVTYDNSTYTATFRLDYSNVSISSLKNTQLVIQLPEGVSPPTAYNGESLYIMQDSSIGTYIYYQEDGIWYVQLTFTESYLSQYDAGATLDGYVSLSMAVIDSSAENETDHTLDVTVGDVKIEIDSTKITWSDSSTPDADISVTKSADSSILSSNSIQYTVVISTVDGTAHEINLSDILTIGSSDLLVDSVTINSVKLYDSSAGSTTSACCTENSSAGSTTGAGYTENSSATAILDVTLDALDAGDYYTIVYTVTFKGDIDIDINTYVNNKVTASTESDWSPDAVVDTADSYVSVKYNMISKSASASDDGSTVTWTIVVNSDNQDIAGYTLSDTMLSSGSNVTITANGSTAGSSEYTINENGSITFNGISDGKNTNSYTITYTTEADPALAESASQSNTATLTDGDKSFSTGTVTGGSGSGGNVNKELTGSTENSDGTVTLSWTSTITVPDGGIRSGTEIVDYLTDGTVSWYTSLGNHYYTYDQIIAVLGSCASGVTIGGTDVPGSSYELYAYYINKTDGTSGWVSYSDLADTSGEYCTKSDEYFYTAFKLTFISDVAASGDLTFTYTSTADTNNLANDNTYKNQMQATYNNNTISDSGSYDYTALVVKTDSNGNTGTTNYTSTDGTVTWYVRIYIPKGYSGENFTVKDTLPTEYVSLTSITVKASDNSVTLNDTSEWSGTLNGGQVYGEAANLTIEATVYSSLAASEGGYITIQYICTLTDEAKTSASTGRIGLTNSVTVLDGSSPYGTAEQTQDVYYDDGSRDISKVGEWDSANSIYTYTVTINPDAETLNSENDLTFTDTLTAHDYYAGAGAYNWGVTAVLQNETVKFYAETSNGDGTYTRTELTDIAWYYTQEEREGDWGITKTDHIISASVPDGVRIVMVCSYVIEDNYGNLTNLQGSGRDNLVSNVASIAGDSTSDSAEFNSSSVDSYNDLYDSGVSSNNTFKLIKVDAEKGYGVTLSGATYQIYKWTVDTENPDGYWLDTKITFTTDSNGTFSFDSNDLVYTDEQTNGKDYYAVNTAYKLVEVVAPDGYIADSEYYFYWSDSDNTITAYPSSTFTTSSTYNAYDLADSTAIVYAENSPVPDDTPTTTVTAMKEWKNADGDPITDSSEMANITLEVYRYESTELITDEVESTDSDKKVTVYVIYGSSYWSTPSDDNTIASVSVSPGTEVPVTLTAGDSTYPYLSYYGYLDKSTNTGYDLYRGWDTETKKSTASFSVTPDSEDIVIAVQVYNGNWSEGTKDNVSVSFTTASSGSSGSTAADLTTAGSLYATVSVTNTDPLEATITGGNGADVSDVTITATRDNTAGTWSLALKGLDYIYYDSNGIAHYYYYYFKENSVDGYTTTYSTADGVTNKGSITITNAAEDGEWDYVSISVTKDWKYVDSSGNAITGTVADSDKESVVVGLYRVTDEDTDSPTLVETVTLEGTNNWSYTWSKLQSSFTKTKENNPSTAYTYYVAELSAGSNTVSTVWENVSETDTITVTYNGENVTANKVDATPGSNPTTEAVTVTNTVPGTTSLQVTKSWQYSDGTVVEAPLSEVTVTLYRISGTGSSGTELTNADLTNSGQTASVTLNSGNNWSCEWINLPITDGNGTSYSYYVVETDVTGYTTYYTSSATVSVSNKDEDPSAQAGEDNIIVINRYNSTDTSVSIKKVWKNSNGEIASPGSASASFTLIQVLYAPDGTTVQSAQIYDVDASDGIVDGEITLTSGDTNGWSYTWTNLPTTEVYTDSASGNTLIGTYKYYVVESSAEYGSQTDNFQVTYTDKDTTAISGTTITLTGGSSPDTYYVIGNGTTVTATNTVEDSIVLPVTGGSGIRNLILITGSTLMLFAIAVILARQREKRRWSSA